MSFSFTPVVVGGTIHATTINAIGTEVATLVAATGVTGSGGVVANGVADAALLLITPVTGQTVDIPAGITTAVLTPAADGVNLTIHVEPCTAIAGVVTLSIITTQTIPLITWSGGPFVAIEGSPGIDVLPSSLGAGETILLRWLPPLSGWLQCSPNQGAFG